MRLLRESGSVFFGAVENSVEHSMFVCQVWNVETSPVSLILERISSSEDVEGMPYHGHSSGGYPNAEGGAGEIGKLVQFLRPYCRRYPT